MNKKSFKWLSIVVSLATMLVIGGCGGGGSSAPAAAPTAKVAGTVTFPTAASVSLASLGKRVTKSVAALTTDTTVVIQLRDLSGKLIATTNPLTDGTYEFPPVPLADYVVKATRGNTVMKAIVDLASLSEATPKTRNVDSASTTAVVVAEQKLGATLGTLGDTENTAKFTTAAIAAVNTQALESKIFATIGTVTGSNSASASAADIALMNLINTVTASVFNNVNPVSIITGDVAVPTTMTTTQYSTSGGVTIININVTILPATILQTVTTTATAYVAPAVDTVTFTSRIMEYTVVSTGTAVAGAEVGASTGQKTVTDADGYYTLAGIVKSTDFIVKMSKTGYVDSYSSKQNITANSNSSSRPYALFTATNLTNWGNTTGNAVISARVVNSTNLDTGYIAGVVVTATDAASATTTYPVTYTNATTGNLDTSLTSTSANGKWMFLNVPAGRTVNVTATKSGYTFNTRTFVTVADSVCQGRLIGTGSDPVVVVPPPPLTSPAKTLLTSGLYDLNSNWSSVTNKEYFFIDKINLAANGVSLQETPISYLDPTLKTWSTVVPAGFPVNSDTGYALNTSGSWVTRNDGPSDFTLAFNADDTVTMTSNSSGQTAKLTVTTVDISGQTLSSQAQNLFGVPVVTSAAVFPAGSARYDMIWDSLSNDYTLWEGGYGTSLGTDLTLIPSMFVVGNTNYKNVYIDSSTAYDYQAQFVGGGSNVVNIYQYTSYSMSQPALVGTATYAFTTANTKNILEITIPTALRTQYQLGNNPIFAVAPTGYVMQGDHSAPGISYSNGQNSLNLIAVNHLKSSMDTSMLPKAAVAKKISKTILGF